MAASLKTLDLVSESSDLREKLRKNTSFFRKRMVAFGFDILPGEHPIVPVILGDAGLASSVADLLLKKGVYVVAFSYPVAPEGRARIRCQISAIHTQQDLEFASAKFAEAKSEMAI